MSTQSPTNTSVDVVSKRPPNFQSLLEKYDILKSIYQQLPSDSILALYHTSRSLRRFLRDTPTYWQSLSFRLYQPAPVFNAAVGNNNNNPHHNFNDNHNIHSNVPRQSRNYAVDQLLIYVVNPFSTQLKSLELDNTAVCGTVLTTSVLHLRRETLEHISVRGCKNVSLKYHILPFLTLHSLANEVADGKYAPVQRLALKSLYTYRCRHHRRRPYLPSSLTRKDSDSEPTHQLVELCHKMGIWTDTAWCTTPGGRCQRRRGYVTMRVPQDPREVWVVYDRLWRSRNWIGRIEQGGTVANISSTKKRKRDCRSWEFEDAVRGEALGTGEQGKGLPAHLRRTHRQFVCEVQCDSCAEVVTERCEQCSVTMHCSGCRKTLCASCAYDRPYLRNKTAADEETNKFWWAPGCAVSPCSMQDQDPTPIPPNANPGSFVHTGLPGLRFKWCCTEPVFSGGGGITFGPGATHDHDQIRAAPLSAQTGWIDPEFIDDGAYPSDRTRGPAGRWTTIDAMFRRDDLAGHEQPSSVVPRNLCDECYASHVWKVKCKVCSTPVCLKHDVRDKLRARICGYKDMSTEKLGFRARQKAKQQQQQQQQPSLPPLRRGQISDTREQLIGNNVDTPGGCPALSAQVVKSATTDVPTTPMRAVVREGIAAELASTNNTPASIASTAGPPGRFDIDILNRPSTPGSNSTASPSRASSPAPSECSTSSSDRMHISESQPRGQKDLPPDWRGCQSFICSQNRGTCDHRRRCVAVVKQCMDCKINICGGCVTSMDSSCPCKGCRPSPSGNSAMSTTVNDDGIDFYCPNCRWQRRQDGRCKRKVASSSSSKKRNGRYRKPLSERKSYPNSTVSAGPGEPSGYEDNTMEMVSSFFGNMLMDEGASQICQKSEQGQRTETMAVDEDMQELENLGEEARDLMSRIQALRSQYRPTLAAAMVVPRIVVENEENADAYAMTAAAAAAAAGADEEPLVEEMD